MHQQCIAETTACIKKLCCNWQGVYEGKSGKTYVALIDCRHGHYLKVSVPSAILHHLMGKKVHNAEAYMRHDFD